MLCKSRPSAIQESQALGATMCRQRLRRWLAHRFILLSKNPRAPRAIFHPHRRGSRPRSTPRRDRTNAPGSSELDVNKSVLTPITSTPFLEAFLRKRPLVLTHGPQLSEHWRTLTAYSK